MQRSSQVVTMPTNQHPALYRPDVLPVTQPTAVLKVVQKRRRVSPAIRGRVPLRRNFFLSENGDFWCILSGILCDLELQETKQETVVDPANQKVPGLRPGRSGPTLSPD